MDDIPVGILAGLLLLLIVLSGFFSASETGMMAINRYRLRHLAAKKHPGARRVLELLQRPDRLIGVILLGNNFVNILASSLATVLAVRWFGDIGIAYAAGTLTVVIIIFSEVAPKTVAALRPEKVAFPASLVIKPLLTLLYPLVWLINGVANSLLRLIGVSPDKHDSHRLSPEELRSVVHEAGDVIPKRHQEMLLAILDLERVTVEDIMVPRNEIIGVDLEESTDAIIGQLANCPHTRVPVYRDSIDNVVGIVHMRKLLRLFHTDQINKKVLQDNVQDAYFVPEGTSLHTQLLNFQRYKQQVGLVVNEYGDIQGMVTLADILEEIVGEFSTRPDSMFRDIYPQDDGSFLVDGSITLRELNKALHWHLSTDGPKTLNGLILEYLEAIPEANVSLRLGGYPIEIVKVKNNAIKMVRIYPAQWQHP